MHVMIGKSAFGLNSNLIIDFFEARSASVKRVRPMLNVYLSERRLAYNLSSGYHLS